MRVKKRYHSPFLLVIAILLLLAFLASSVHLLHESIWYDEGWTLWAVLDVEPISDVPPRDAVRGLITNVREVVNRVRADVHPPLYFLLFDGWTMGAGDSVYSGRLFSTFWGLIGLAGTYALGVRLFDRKTALIACALLATSTFFIYFNREIRMYSMVLALSVLATRWYLIWANRPTTVRMLPYALSITALLYTHYAGAVLILAHIGHLLITRLYRLQWKLIWWYARPYVVAIILFFPWLIVLNDQINAHPDGALAFPIPTNVDTFIDLLNVLSSGTLWIVYLLIFAWAIINFRKKHQAMTILLCWLILPPAILLFANATITDIYQNRYIIGILPAFILIIAYGITHLQRIFKPPLRQPIMLASVSVLMIVQVVNFTNVWGDKPGWEGATLAMLETRDLNEPAITHIAGSSVLGYYDRVHHLRQGIALDLSWREHSLDEMLQFVDVMQNSESVWIVMPTNVAKTWHGMAFLDIEYAPVYRDSVLNMVFYRFDREDDGVDASDLQFHFGDVVSYNGDLATPYSIHAGEQFCPDNLAFTALRDVDTRYSIGLHLMTNHQVPIAQWDGGLGAHDMDESFTVNECLDIPENIALGEYHLRLVIYEWENVTNQQVLETSGDQPILWGEHMVVASVVIK